MLLRRGLVLVADGCAPNALLVDKAPQIKSTWAHRLLDPVKLELLVPQRAMLELVADSDSVAVFALPLSTRRAITGLGPDNPAWQAWVAHDERSLPS